MQGMRSKGRLAGASKKQHFYGIHERYRDPSFIYIELKEKSLAGRIKSTLTGYQLHDYPCYGYFDNHHKDCALENLRGI